jgi:hypothetical protein
MYVPEDYLSDISGFYPDEQHKNTLQPASSSTQKSILSSEKKSSAKKSTKTSSATKVKGPRTD